MLAYADVIRLLPVPTELHFGSGFRSFRSIQMDNVIWKYVESARLQFDNI